MRKKSTSDSGSPRSNQSSPTFQKQGGSLLTRAKAAVQQNFAESEGRSTEPHKQQYEFTEEIFERQRAQIPFAIQQDPFFPPNEEEIYHEDRANSDRQSFSSDHIGSRIYEEVCEDDGKDSGRFRSAAADQNSAFSPHIQSSGEENVQIHEGSRSQHNRIHVNAAYFRQINADNVSNASEGAENLFEYRESTYKQAQQQNCDQRRPDCLSEGTLTPTSIFHASKQHLSQQHTGLNQFDPQPAMSPPQIRSQVNSSDGLHSDDDIACGPSQFYGPFGGSGLWQRQGIKHEFNHNQGPAQRQHYAYQQGSPSFEEQKPLNQGVSVQIVNSRQNIPGQPVMQLSQHHVLFLQTPHEQPQEIYQVLSNTPSHNSATKQANNVMHTPQKNAQEAYGMGGGGSGGNFQVRSRKTSVQSQGTQPNTPNLSYSSPMPKRNSMDETFNSSNQETPNQIPAHQRTHSGDQPVPMMKFYPSQQQQQHQVYDPQEMMQRRVQSNSAGKHSTSSSAYQLGHHHHHNQYQHQQFESQGHQGYYNQFARHLGVTQQIENFNLRQNSHAFHHQNHMKQPIPAYGPYAAHEPMAQPYHQQKQFEPVKSGGSRKQSQSQASQEDFEQNIDASLSELIQKLEELDEQPSAGNMAKLNILRGNVGRLAKTQQGSKFLQRMITNVNQDLVEFFLNEIGADLSSMMVDNYGNYFCSELLAICSSDQRLHILRTVDKNFIRICMSKKGTHAIQKMFALTTLPEERDVIRQALAGKVFQLSMDQQGTHVIQKLLECRIFEQDQPNFIFEEVYDNLNELAINQHGLCVIKKIVAKTHSPVLRHRLLQKISGSVIKLSQDQFANFAIKEILKHWDSETCSTIYNQVINQINELSIQKFSSNTIEACLTYSDELTRSRYIQQITRSSCLHNLIKNQFGNYVVQCALKCAASHDKAQLVKAIKQALPQIHDKKIRIKWEEDILGQPDESQQIIQSTPQKGRQQPNKRKGPGSHKAGRKGGLCPSDHPRKSQSVMNDGVQVTYKDNNSSTAATGGSNGGARDSNKSTDKQVQQWYQPKQQKQNVRVASVVPTWHPVSAAKKE